MARPTKYNEDILEKTEHYLENHTEYKDVIPSVAGLAYVLSVSRKTLYNWGEKHAEFLHILEDINSKQEKILLSSGLSGDFNSAITKLALGKHGYHDKQQQEISGPDGKPQEFNYTIQVVDAKPTDT